MEVNPLKILDQGEVLRCRRTGVDFEVKKVTGDFVILQSRPGLQVMTGVKSVFRLFEKVSEGASAENGSRKFA